MAKKVIANLKMNLTANEVGDYLVKIENLNNSNVVICPTALYLPYFLNKSFAVGIQNVFYEDSGAFTGEISPLQCRSLGIAYTLIGHSERRLQGETDEIINKKVIATVRNNLTAIVCIGESQAEKGSGLRAEVLSRQLNSALADVTDASKVIIAYEPVWAISTSSAHAEVATITDISEAITLIKNIVKEKYNEDIRVLYGGSVNKGNIREIGGVNVLDGVLVGSASLKPDELIEIIEVIC